jgi:glycosyltransferase involved in cell wall biosynthesis
MSKIIEYRELQAMKNVLVIVFNNFTNDNRVLKESLSLKKQGYNVQVLALHKKSLKEYEEIDGIKVHRIKLVTKRLPKVFYIQLIKITELIIKIVSKYRNVDIIHCNDLDTLPVGYIIKMLNRCKSKIVYDAHEYETERKPKQKFWKKRLLQFVEGFFIKSADTVFSVSNSIANEYVRLYKIKKPILILNCPPYNITKKDIFRKNLSIRKEQRIFLYQGGFQPNRGIEMILETFAGLEDQKNVIVFMGNGNLHGLIDDYAQKNENIYLVPSVSPNELMDYTSSADVGLLLYEDSCLNHRYCLPNKLFEYIMAKIPIVINDLPEVKKVVTYEKIGWVLKRYDADCLKDIISKIQENKLYEMKINCENTSEKYCWEKQEISLINSYNRLIEA